MHHRALIFLQSNISTRMAWYSWTKMEYFAIVLVKDKLQWRLNWDIGKLSPGLTIFYPSSWVIKLNHLRILSFKNAFFHLHGAIMIWYLLNGSLLATAAWYSLIMSLELVNRLPWADSNMPLHSAVYLNLCIVDKKT